MADTSRRPMTPQDLTRIRFVSDPQMSPDGRTYDFTLRIDPYVYEYSDLDVTMEAVPRGRNSFFTLFDFSAKNDPVPTMQMLQTPSLWILAGEDASAPTPWTLRELEKLQAAGRPVQYHVFPAADHGIMTFVKQENGERRYTGIEPEYYPMQIAWLRAHN